MKNQKIMSRKFKFTIFFVAAIVLFAATTLAACDKQETANIASMPAAYDVNMTYDDALATIEARQQTLFTMPEGCDEGCVVFHIYANAFCAQHDAIDILSCQIDRQNVDFEIFGSDRTLLLLPYSGEGGRLVNVDMTYRIRVPDGSGRLGRSQDVANLTCFYPVLAKYEDGWRRDEYVEFGDPFFCDVADFYVTLTLDGDLSVASSGIKEETPLVKDGKNLKMVEITAENIRDFGMAVGKFDTLSKKVELESGSVDVNYFYIADSAADETLSVACAALKTFSETFGDYPYPAYTLAESPLGGAGGMEYGGFSILSPAARDVYLDAAVHETAHQWWYGAVGNDQLEIAWLDEGMSEFCTHYFHYLQGDRTTFKRAIAAVADSYGEFASLAASVGFDGRMERHLSTYLTDGEYVAVTYKKGALLFNSLRELVGDKKFVAALRAYYAANKFKIATPSSLAAAFKTQGYDISPILAAWTER